MGACGCVDIQYQAKIIGSNGDAWCLGVYGSCHDCSSPAGIQVLRVTAGSDLWHTWDIDEIPLLQVCEHSDMAFISVIDPGKVRAAMADAIVGYKPEGGTTSSFTQIHCRERRAMPVYNFSAIDAEPICYDWLKAWGFHKLERLERQPTDHYRRCIALETVGESHFMVAHEDQCLDVAPNRWPDPHEQP